MCEGIGMWMPVNPGARTSRMECQKALSRNPCNGFVLVAGRPFGLPRANVPACRGDPPKEVSGPGH